MIASRQGEYERSLGFLQQAENYLHTDDFWRDYKKMLSGGIHFVREPKNAAYGTVAVFEDLYGNLWDLIQPNDPQTG